MAEKQDFGKVALTHLDAVYRTAVALSHDRDQADDLTQTTFLKAFEKFSTFQPGTSCRAWLLRILRNTWIDQIRHRKVTGETLTVDEHLLAARPEGDPTHWSDARDVLENFSDEEVIRALKRLPDDQRLSVFLLDVEQLSQEEVAEIMGVAVGTIKSRTHRARTALKDELMVHAKELGFLGKRS